ncbi:Hsp70 family protein [Angustibacter sp. McL0619]|uniref:Hsp70 family protein n=1 Tax=Angustibacter sp. McL0619 TaxID=3415676 RepID=UPI003CF1529A
MSFGLGIDVGTTFTAAATWQDGRASVLPLAQRSDAVPTVVYVPAQGTWVVGDAAERHAHDDPTRLARAFKRRMGDPVPLHLGDRQVMPVELTAHMLRWVVAQATEREALAPSQVVLTAPAEWGDYRLDVLREAADTAGIGAVELVPEPVAAAVYYGSQHRIATGDTLGVFDLGGGTFDAALVRRAAVGYEVRGKPIGDPSLGGLDLDDEILAHVRENVNWHQVDEQAPQTLAALAALRAQAVLAKEALSVDVDTSIPVLLPGAAGTIRLTRREFELRSEPYVDRAVATFSEMLRRADLRPTDLAAVLLVGGGSRMPLVAERLTSSLGLAVVVDTHPKYAICLGAAVLAGSRLSGSASPTLSPTLSPALSPAEQRPKAEAGTAVPAAPEAESPARINTTVGEPHRRGSRVSIAADLAEAGLVPSGSSLPGSRRDDPLVVQTGGQGSWLSPKLLVVLLAVVALAAVGLALAR